MYARVLLVLCLLLACWSLVLPLDSPPESATPDVATFSIVGFDPETGDLGVAVQSRFFGVGAVVPWAHADIGAVATQAFANTTYGPEGLALLDDGVAPEDVVQRLTAADSRRDRRQVGVVDAQGRAAAHTGAKCMDWAGHRTGEGFCCQGNILAGKAVVDAMAKAFERAEGPLAERLVEALEAGQQAGGDKRGRQSAALLVVRRGGGYAGQNDRYIDLHVEDHPRPIKELTRLLALWRRSLPAASVPPKLEGLEREVREASPPRSTPRSAWEAAKREGRVRGHYLGTRRTEEGAEIHTFVPGARRVERVRMVQDEDKTWRISD